MRVHSLGMLTIVKSLVKMMKGAKVKVKSKRGLGTGVYCLSGF